MRCFSEWDYHIKQCVKSLVEAIILNSSSTLYLEFEAYYHYQPNIPFENRVLVSKGDEKFLFVFSLKKRLEECSQFYPQ